MQVVRNRKQVRLRGPLSIIRDGRRGVRRREWLHLTFIYLALERLCARTLCLLLPVPGFELSLDLWDFWTLPVSDRIFSVALVNLTLFLILTTRLYDSAPVRSYSGYGKYSDNFKFVAQFHCNHLLKQKSSYISHYCTLSPHHDRKSRNVDFFFFLQIY